MQTTPDPPKGLALAGQRLWRDVTSAYEQTVAERVALTSACRTLDELVALETVVDDVSPLVTGSTGQQRIHPVYAEVRAHRAALAKHLADAGLSAAHGTASASAAGRQLVSLRYR
jgi:hypothetical protein